MNKLIIGIFFSCLVFTVILSFIADDTKSIGNDGEMYVSKSVDFETQFENSHFVNSAAFNSSRNSSMSEFQLPSISSSSNLISKSKSQYSTKSTSTSSTSTQIAVVNSTKYSSRKVGSDASSSFQASQNSNSFSGSQNSSSNTSNSSNFSGTSFPSISNFRLNKNSSELNSPFADFPLADASLEAEDYGPQRDGVSPGGDPIEPAIPVHDGIYFLSLLAFLYFTFRSRLFPRF